MALTIPRLEWVHTETVELRDLEKPEVLCFSERVVEVDNVVVEKEGGTHRYFGEILGIRMLLAEFVWNAKRRLVRYVEWNEAASVCVRIQPYDISNSFRCTRSDIRSCRDQEFIAWHDMRQTKSLLSGREHGFQERRQFGFPFVSSLSIRGRTHGFQINVWARSNEWFWHGVQVKQEEFRERLPRAESLVTVLPLSVARRVVSFL
jgi:hypothetical protein